MEPKILIKALGGTKAVSQRTGQAMQTVYMWGRRGNIPAEHHISLWQMAVEAGVDWQPEGADELRQLLANPPPPTSVAA